MYDGLRDELVWRRDVGHSVSAAGADLDDMANNNHANLKADGRELSDVDQYAGLVVRPRIVLDSETIEQLKEEGSTMSN